MMRKTIFNTIVLSCLVMSNNTTQARTVYVYLENKTNDTIFAVQNKTLEVVLPGKKKVIGSQERTPTQKEDSHSKPGTISSDILVYLFKIQNPITINVVTSSTEAASVGHLVKRDKLEWTVSHPSAPNTKDRAEVKSSSRYVLNKNYSGNSSHAYLIQGEKQGADIPALPAADIHFTIEETK